MLKNTENIATRSLQANDARESRRRTRKQTTLETKVLGSLVRNTLIQLGLTSAIVKCAK